MPALDVALEIGGIRECLVTQVALCRREAVEKGSIRSLESAGDSSYIKIPVSLGPLGFFRNGV